MSAQKVWPAIRDIGCFALGAFILVHSEWTGRASESLTLAAVALCGGYPVVMALIGLRTGRQVAVSISESSSPPASPSSSSPPSG